MVDVAKNDNSSISGGQGDRIPVGATVRRAKHPLGRVVNEDEAVRSVHGLE
jgi:hypothetical protein